MNVPTNKNHLSSVLLETRVQRIPWSGCWIWMGSLNTQGYGIISIDGKNRLAHRASWRVFSGDPGALYVLHKCDEPTCINPEHLFLGTHRDNMADASRKGRKRYYKTDKCNSGHPLTGRKDGVGRECLTCKNERLRATRKRGQH